MRSRAIQRITDVNQLKTRQFAEDAGPMAHPVRPESYIAMDNFYTSTVYEKGAEVIRMIHTILGEEGFQKGMGLYFDRHDGDAVTIDDFVASMADANNYNFENYRIGNNSRNFNWRFYWSDFHRIARNDYGFNMN